MEGNLVTHFPRDADGIPIQVLRLRSGGAHALAVGTNSARLGPFAADTRVINLFATGPVFVRSGDGQVLSTQSDHYLPEGVYISLSLGGPASQPHTHLAAIAAAAGSTLYASEME